MIDQKMLAQYYQRMNGGFGQSQQAQPQSSFGLPALLSRPTAPAPPPQIAQLQPLQQQADQGAPQLPQMQQQQLSPTQHSMLNVGAGIQGMVGGGSSGGSGSVDAGIQGLFSGSGGSATGATSASSAMGGGSTQMDILKAILALL